MSRYEAFNEALKEEERWEDAILTLREPRVQEEPSPGSRGRASRGGRAAGPKASFSEGLSPPAQASGPAWSAGFLCNSCSSEGHSSSLPKDAAGLLSRKSAPCRAPGHGSQAAAVPSTLDALGFPPFFSPSLAALGAQGHPEPEGPVPWDLSAGQQSAASSRAASCLLLLRRSPRPVCPLGSPSSLSLLSCLISPL